MALPTVGTVSYNGYTFGERTETLGITGRPVYDAAQRTITHTVYGLTLRTVIADADGTDTTLEDVRRRLQSPGGALVYSGKGFGALSINVGNVKDVVWGPRPQILTWVPKGSAQACEVTWSVEVAIPECTAATYQFRAMEFVYTLAFEIDRSGYTRRNYSGHLRIPQTRVTQATRTLADTADSYRERCVPQTLPGFRREQQSFALDESKCKLTFSVVDVELPPNVPPDGVVEVTASHTVRNAAPYDLTRYIGEITATYEVAKGVPRDSVWPVFQGLVIDRLKPARSATLTTGTPAGIKPAPIVTNLSVGEPEIFGRRNATFSVSYFLVSSEQTIIKDSGLWTPVRANASTWQTSMSKGTSAPRGHAQLRHRIIDDTIVDLCAPGQDVALGGAKVQPIGLLGQLNQLLQPVIEAASSWLYYDCSLRVIPDSGAIVHRTLPPQVVNLKPATGSSNIPRTFGIVESSIPWSPPSATPAVTQQRHGGMSKVILEGRAVRVGFKIPVPTLVRVGGLPATPMNHTHDHDGFSQVVVGNVGVPIYAAKWKLLYTVPGIPKGDLPVPTHPHFGG